MLHTPIDQIKNRLQGTLLNFTKVQVTTLSSIANSMYSQGYGFDEMGSLNIVRVRNKIACSLKIM